MLRGDITKLAKAIGVKRQTIYARAKRMGVSLKQIGLRDPKTADMFSGEVLEDEYQAWFNNALKKLSGASNGK